VYAPKSLQVIFWRFLVWVMPQKVYK